MNTVAQVAALLAGIFHVLIFTMESLLFTRPHVHKRFLVTKDQVSAVKPWALNQGFYNLFLAVGAIAGVVTVWAGSHTIGTTLAAFTCACMLAASLVLLASDRRMAKAAAAQGLLPLIALIGFAL